MSSDQGSSSSEDTTSSSDEWSSSSEETVAPKFISKSKSNAKSNSIDENEQNQEPNARQRKALLSHLDSNQSKIEEQDESESIDAVDDTDDLDPELDLVELGTVVAMSLSPLPESIVPFLSKYLPVPKDKKVFLTLTYAQSIDSRIAAQAGVQTKLSHSETKTMTHYLRSKHDAILVGVNTVVVDDAKLNCRYGSKSEIRPIILDPRKRWRYAKSQLRKVCEMGQGLAPFIIIDDKIDINLDDEDAKTLELQGGKYIQLPLLMSSSLANNSWRLILDKLYKLGIKSIMVEGGATVINSLLSDFGDLIDCLIITIAPVFLGKKGVEVSPSHITNLQDINWWTGVQDSVMCARIKHLEGK
ncbi:RIB7 [Candida oxycetoniae]|uniref:2,5-diamino-6-ribosylamino-4(3H)-pyrimidinone 5'-phosphate reductase n=1 Tax=Candida oxycetoniae TaxID=497107 RepID=A0AAI9SUI8_9ASCO|nr:RIB7 [Candida oxycetoniae]KAI3402944.2 RIB7 [Candida oxycetoniae]